MVRLSTTLLLTIRILPLPTRALGTGALELPMLIKVDFSRQAKLVPLLHLPLLVSLSFCNVREDSWDWKSGVAIYYFMPLFQNITGGVSTLLSLDSGPTQLVNLTRVTNESTRVAVRWSATGLSNGKHTLVSSPGRTSRGEVAGWGEVDGFMYIRVFLASTTY